MPPFPAGQVSCSFLERVVGPDGTSLFMTGSAHFLTWTGSRAGDLQSGGGSALGKRSQQGVLSFAGEWFVCLPETIPRGPGGGPGGVWGTEGDRGGACPAARSFFCFAFFRPSRLFAPNGGESPMLRRPRAGNTPLSNTPGTFAPPPPAILRAIH